jgi:hypothetical protein
VILPMAARGTRDTLQGTTPANKKLETGHEDRADVHDG